MGCAAASACAPTGPPNAPDIGHGHTYAHEENRRRHAPLTKYNADHIAQRAKTEERKRGGGGRRRGRGAAARDDLMEVHEVRIAAVHGPGVAARLHGENEHRVLPPAPRVQPRLGAGDARRALDGAALGLAVFIGRVVDGAGERAACRRAGGAGQAGHGRGKTMGHEARGRREGAGGARSGLHAAECRSGAASTRGHARPEHAPGTHNTLTPSFAQPLVYQWC